MTNPNSNRREPFIGAPDDDVRPDHGLDEILGQNAARGNAAAGVPRGGNPYEAFGSAGRPGAPAGQARTPERADSGARPADSGGKPAASDEARVAESGANADPAIPADLPIYADEQAALASLTAEVEKLQAELASARERQVRALAETENIRRRASEDVAKAYKFSIEGFAEAMLPVVDSLEMSLKVESPTVEALREGSQATLRQLQTAFEKNKLIAIDPVGEKFDPNRHQAISTVPASAVNPPLPANHVASVLQKGYLINDRVLRPALVMVVQG